MTDLVPASGFQRRHINAKRSSTTRESEHSESLVHATCGGSRIELVRRCANAPAGSNKGKIGYRITRELRKRSAAAVHTRIQRVSVRQIAIGASDATRPNALPKKRQGCE
ncbi:hypothetical protein ACVI1L_000519 [Bradyrhizobium sp. USDA 4516]